MINPVLLSVVLLCTLCLFKVNVLLSMLLAIYVAGLCAGLPIVDQVQGDQVITGITTYLAQGFSKNATTALAYVLLGTLASAMVHTGLTGILGQKAAQLTKEKQLPMMLFLFVVAILSQNFIPVQIAFIPILIPPLLPLMNRLKLDRSLLACVIATGIKCSYVAIPLGFGAEFHNIVAVSMTSNGTQVTAGQVAQVTWIIALCMLVGLVIAALLTYKAPRSYRNLPLGESEEAVPDKLEKKHWLALGAILCIVILQLWIGSLAVSALVGILVLLVTGAIPLKDLDQQFVRGIKYVGFIAFVMLVAGGFASVMEATGGIATLVEETARAMSGNKVTAALVLAAIGLLVTMGTGSSFSTVPILAGIYVPLCAQLGFSVPATILLLAGAGVLGDAGSPASDTTLGITAGLDVDGQHDHIWDSCVPTFIHINVPIMIGIVIAAQVI